MVTNGVEVDGLRDGTREGNAKYDLVRFKASRRLDSQAHRLKNSAQLHRSSRKTIVRPTKVTGPSTIVPSTTRTSRKRRQSPPRAVLGTDLRVGLQAPRSGQQKVGRTDTQIGPPLVCPPRAQEQPPTQQQLPVPQQLQAETGRRSGSIALGELSRTESCSPNREEKAGTAGLEVRISVPDSRQLAQA